jgi:hypothetical protein
MSRETSLIVLKFFNLEDISSYVLWLIIFTICAHIIHGRNKENPIFKYYLYQYYFGVISSFLFAMAYLIYYQGGDTTAYYDGAIALKNLLFHDPSIYFSEIFDTTVNKSVPAIYYKFHETLPPSWIYRDPNSFSVCKFYSLPAIFCFESYLALNLMAGLLSSWVGWRFYRFLIGTFHFNTKRLAIALFFIPTASISLHCLMKDTIVFIGFQLVTMGLLTLVTSKDFRFSSLFLIILGALFTLTTRSFTLLIALISMFLFLSRYVGINKKAALRIPKKVMFYLFGSILIFLSISVLGDSVGSLFLKLQNESQVIHDDFSNNLFYTGEKYDLGEIDFSSVAGMTAIIPSALNVSFFRPYPWEVSNPLILLNSLESLLLFYLCLRFVFSKKRNGINKLKKNPIIVYFLVSAVILGYMVGITSILWGVLLRMKAPVVIFLAIVLISSFENTENENQSVPSR